jgi:hypothetical protein
MPAKPGRKPSLVLLHFSNTDTSSEMTTPT